MRRRGVRAAAGKVIEQTPEAYLKNTAVRQAVAQDYDDVFPEEKVELQSVRSTEGAGQATAIKRFAALPISPGTKRAIMNDMKFKLMTDVQAEVIPPVLRGEDVIGRAKTGTGKTLAFLIPIAETIRFAPPEVGGQVRALIIEPTRELAAQTAGAAKELLKYHEGYGVFSMMGEANYYDEMQMLETTSLDVLVATPGRLLEHITRTPGFKEQLRGLKILVLDEADRLLSGFRGIIEEIVWYLPWAAERQGLMFSATFPRDVSEIAAIALRQSYKMIDLVTEEEEVTPSQIVQTYTVVPLEDMAQVLWKVLKDDMAQANGKAKIMVFFTTARLTQYYAEVFRRVGDMHITEMHSRRAQLKRFTSADDFWRATSGIFFTTDVSARGLDYPNVTTVIHFGAPSSVDRYVHRLGRSGRMGAIGRSIMLLHDFEESFLQRLSSVQLTLTEVPTPDIYDDPPPRVLKVPLDEVMVGQAYKAWLGYFNYFSSELGWTKDDVVRQATRFAKSIGGLDDDGKPPPLKRRTAAKMELGGARGLNVMKMLPYLEEAIARRKREEAGKELYFDFGHFTGELGALFEEWDAEARADGLTPLLPPQGFGPHRTIPQRSDAPGSGRQLQPPDLDQQPESVGTGNLGRQLPPQPTGDGDLPESVFEERAARQELGRRGSSDWITFGRPTGKRNEDQDLVNSRLAAIEALSDILPARPEKKAAARPALRPDPRPARRKETAAAREARWEETAAPYEAKHPDVGQRWDGRAVRRGDARPLPPLQEGRDSLPPPVF